MNRLRMVLLGLSLLVCGAAYGTPAAQAQSQAQDYPSRPVKIIVPTPPGGPIDVMGRLAAHALQTALGQGFIIENRAGAGNTIGSKDAAEATPDGYTLLYSSASGLVISPLLHPDIGYDALKSYDPIALVAASSNILVVNPAVPAKTVAELVAYAKANPGKVNMASSGIGTSVHLSGALFMMMTGVDLVHVPYRGSAPALTDLLGGQVQVMFDNLPSSIGHIQAGRLRALAVTTTTRSPALPNVPTVAETVPGYEASAWFGMGVPKGTPRDIIDKLNRTVNEALADPAMQAKLAELGGALIPGTPEDFGKIIADETEKWSKVVKATGASAE